MKRLLRHFKSFVRAYWYKWLAMTVELLKGLLCYTTLNFHLTSLQGKNEGSNLMNSRSGTFEKIASPLYVFRKSILVQLARNDGSLVERITLPL